MIAIIPAKKVLKVFQKKYIKVNQHYFSNKLFMHLYIKKINQFLLDNKKSTNLKDKNYFWWENIKSVERDGLDQ